MSALSIAEEDRGHKVNEQILLRTIAGLLEEGGGPMGRLSMKADLEDDLGLGSIERAELLTRVEEAFSVTLPDATFADARTPADVLQAVNRSLGEREAEGPAKAREPVGEVEMGPDLRMPRQWKVPGSVQTLMDVVHFRADVEGGRPHLHLVQDNGREEVLSFADLRDTAQRIGGGLASLGLQTGDRVALMLPTGRDFFVSFYGVLCGGGVPVPIYPPWRLDSLGSYVERESRILANAGARFLITDRQLQFVGKLLRDRLPELTRVVTTTFLDSGEPLEIARGSPDDLGLIQYTSGSTGDPKGVALRHRNLLANMRAISEGLEVAPTDLVVSWLPLYHDMGLIGAWLATLLHGLCAVFLSPLQFLSRPERWLWAIHRHRGTVSPAPNFGFEFCLRKVHDEQIEGLDLSSWRAAMNGSEPVRVETIERFCKRFERYGFRRTAMMPVYGLAETAVALTFPPLGRPPRIERVAPDVFRTTGRAEATTGKASAFVSCGTPIRDHELRIVPPEDPAGPPLPERREGKILFRGPSTMAEYFRHPEATEAARYGDWIDTGDLGFVADGELFVTGRSKDLVIKGGRKYHPQDIEQAAERVDAIRKGCVVAFGVPHALSGEALVVLAETRAAPSRYDELSQAVAVAVQEAVGTPADHVVMLPPHTVPKTSSGKLRRREARSRYLDGTLVAGKTRRWTEMLALTFKSLFARGRTALGRLAAWLYGFYATTVGVTLLVVGGLLLLLFCHRERTAWRFANRSLRFLFFLLGLSPRRVGKPLPDGPSLLVSNHASYLDGLVLLAALDRPVLFAPKAEVFSWPVLGRVVRRLGYLPIERRSRTGRLHGRAAAAEALERGRLIHFFPEGTFTSATGLRPFRLGAFQLAVEHGVPVVPITLRGTREALRGGQFLLRHAPLDVEVHPAHDPPEDTSFRAITQFRDTIRQEMAGAVSEPLLEITTAASPSRGSRSSSAAL